MQDRRQVEEEVHQTPEELSRVQAKRLAEYRVLSYRNVLRELRLPQFWARTRNPELNQVCAGLTG